MFQIPENSLFALLSRSPWWIGIAVAALIIVAASTLLPDGYRLLGAAASLPFFAAAMLSVRRRWNLPGAARIQSARQRCAAMGWPEFSALLEQAYRRDGHSVRRADADTAPPVDFELEQGTRRVVVCARRWKSAFVNLGALRSLQTAREASGASGAIFVGLGELTREAQAFAARHGIEIHQAADLARLLRGKL